MKKLFKLIVLVALMSSCNKQTENHAPVVVDNPILPATQLNAAFLIVDGVYNSELVAPMDILHHSVFHTDPGIKVFTVAPDRDTVVSFEGLQIIPDYGYLTDSLPEIDILIVPSAEHSMSSDLENEDLIKFVKNTGEQAKYVMSLCDGAFVLAKAGLVDGKESTTFPSDIDKYREMFPQLKVHEGVSFVHDGKLITSVGGAKSYDPALYLSQLLYGKKVAEGLGKGLVIDWDLSKIKFVKTP